MPLVVCRRGENFRWLRCVARSVKSFVVRELVEYDYCFPEGVKKYVKELEDMYGEYNRDGGKKGKLDWGYELGEARSMGIGVERYIVVKVDGFDDIYERLIEGHLQKGDEASALITCELYIQKYPSWGFPYVKYIEVLEKVGKRKDGGRSTRELEIRDSCRMALQLPLWTIGKGFEGLVDTAGYKDIGNLKKIYKRLMMEKREKEVADGLKKEQVALDRAAWVLDWAVCDGDVLEKGGWEEVKEQVAALYDEAGLNHIATFVRY